MKKPYFLILLSFHKSTKDYYSNNEVRIMIGRGMLFHFLSLKTMPLLGLRDIYSLLNNWSVSKLQTFFATHPEQNFSWKNLPWLGSGISLGVGASCSCFACGTGDNCAVVLLLSMKGEGGVIYTGFFWRQRIKIEDWGYETLKYKEVKTQEYQNDYIEDVL